MQDVIKRFFGMRKIKSLIALAVCFFIWQLIRLIFPDLEANPIYAYLYAVIEMRNSIETEKRTSLERIKTNVIGFLVAFLAIAARSALWTVPFFEQNGLFVEFALILLGVLLALNIAEWAKCKTLCAIATITFIICFWHTTYNPYFYAFLRFVQTLIGIGAALAVNLIICPPEDMSEANN